SDHATRLPCVSAGAIITAWRLVCSRVVRSRLLACLGPALLFVPTTCGALGGGSTGGREDGSTSEAGSDSADVATEMDGCAEGGSYCPRPCLVYRQTDAGALIPTDAGGFW